MNKVRWLAGRRDGSGAGGGSGADGASRTPARWGSHAGLARRWLSAVTGVVAVAGIALTAAVVPDASAGTSPAASPRVPVLH
jgi:hypothetical protein